MNVLAYEDFRSAEVGKSLTLQNQKNTLVNLNLNFPVYSCCSLGVLLANDRSKFFYSISLDTDNF